jgi:hypothetical protein
MHEDEMTRFPVSSGLAAVTIILAILLVILHLSSPYLIQLEGNHAESFDVIGSLQAPARILLSDMDFV